MIYDISNSSTNVRKVQLADNRSNNPETPEQIILLECTWMSIGRNTSYFILAIIILSVTSIFGYNCTIWIQWPTESIHIVDMDVSRVRRQFAPAPVSYHA